MKREPYMVKIIHAKPENRYTDGMMIAAFPWKKTVILMQPSKTEFQEQDDIWSSMAKMDNMQMLNILSGDKMVDGETFTFRDRMPNGFYINVNGEPADAWIDERGMIGSGKGGGPTWIQWVGYYGRSKGEIAMWFKNKFNL